MTVSFREATVEDVSAMVALLADDMLGKAREGAVPEVYRDAFRRIVAATGNILIVGEQNGRIVAMYHLTMLPGLSNKGATRAQLESVRVASDLRSGGIGKLLLADAEARAKASGADRIQLTSHVDRVDAHRFYRTNGYDQSHTGFKKAL
ncbi:MAG: GNAT family N-acetyltransferase [Paracoccus denitrificans]|nr:MAG: GNAT family N-acetyltransferase [Paracoccus denitrificans]PZO82976.1 MAG: GNAT family N-acetyltransferase [Paracoccus denitrificans]